MSVRDITPATVLAAIRNGSGDVDAAELAEMFEVIPTSHTLRDAIRALWLEGFIDIDRTDPRRDRYTAV